MYDIIHTEQNQILEEPEPQASISDDKPDESATVVDPEPEPNGSTDIEASTSTGEPRVDSDLDLEIMQILGEDPSTVAKYGQNIRAELACRLQHMATEGIGKEKRKELIEKYLIPQNCLHIDAPKINPEMKAAIPEPIAKRDRGIESKQKQIASAIACLSGSLDTLLKATDKNNELIQRLMDAIRLLCDVQHADSITRRNFILFSLKKEVKEHLIGTKIDSMLFSANLAETLKAAKAVSKSGTELKSDYSNTSKQVINNVKKDLAPSSKPFLNRRPAPPAARRPMGPAFREQAAPRAPHHRPQHGRSSRPSFYRPPAQAQRRN
jgi:hypothetical protein